eukprot:TRINITY_DN3311_c1_g1_i1.p1 TRINITY_DN3311_c1_g1~~TRINITY_DN3311_c1_g1_i1.p1  ORF type:complete len:421 (-),score=84.50 TRINITY_DN3311_c1_g1_i1:83-1345(-)
MDPETHTPTPPSPASSRSQCQPTGSHGARATATPLSGSNLNHSATQGKLHWLRLRLHLHLPLRLRRGSALIAAPRRRTPNAADTSSTCDASANARTNPTVKTPTPAPNPGASGSGSSGTETQAQLQADGAAYTLRQLFELHIAQQSLRSQNVVAAVAVGVPASVFEPLQVHEVVPHCLGRLVAAAAPPDSDLGRHLHQPGGPGHTKHPSDQLFDTPRLVRFLSRTGVRLTPEAVLLAVALVQRAAASGRLLEAAFAPDSDFWGSGQSAGAGGNGDGGGGAGGGAGAGAGVGAEAAHWQWQWQSQWVTVSQLCQPLTDAFVAACAIAHKMLHDQSRSARATVALASVGGLTPRRLAQIEHSLFEVGLGFNAHVPLEHVFATLGCLVAAAGAAVPDAALRCYLQQFVDFAHQPAVQAEPVCA